MKKTTLILFLFGFLLFLTLFKILVFGTWILVSMFLLWVVVSYIEIHYNNQRDRTPKPVYLTN